MDRMHPQRPPSDPATAEQPDAQAALERRLSHLFRHASAPGQAPHPLLRLIRLYRVAATEEPPHG